MTVSMKRLVVVLAGTLLLANGASVVAGSDKKTEDKARGFDIKDLPLPVIEACLKEVPDIAFVKVEKQTSWRRGQSFRIWAMDGKERDIYLVVSAAGKIIERPKLIKETKDKGKEAGTPTQTR